MGERSEQYGLGGVVAGRVPAGRENPGPGGGEPHTPELQQRRAPDRSRRLKTLDTSTCVKGPESMSALHIG